jgi:predicted DNA binding CopG/RHH family protein
VGNTYTEAQKKATLKYQADKVKIQILVTPEQREKYRALASSRGLNLTQLIVNLLEKESV